MLCAVFASGRKRIERPSQKQKLNIFQTSVSVLPSRFRLGSTSKIRRMWVLWISCRLIPSPLQFSTSHDGNLQFFLSHPNISSATGLDDSDPQGVVEPLWSEIGQKTDFIAHLHIPHHRNSCRGSRPKPCHLNRLSLCTLMMRRIQSSLPRHGNRLASQQIGKRERTKTTRRFLQQVSTIQQWERRFPHKFTS